MDGEKGRGRGRGRSAGPGRGRGRSNSGARNVGGAALMRQRGGKIEKRLPGENLESKGQRVKTDANETGVARGALTLEELENDSLSKLAQERWSTAALQADKKVAFDPQLVVRLYEEELAGKGDQPPAIRRLMLLEISQYLENYLWPHFDEEASTEHVLSIMAMVNEKFRQTLPAWKGLQAHEDKFAPFFRRVVSLRSARPLSLPERTAYVLFLTHCFQSLENPMVRGQVLRLCSLPLWCALSPGRLQLELHRNEQLAKHWKHQAKKEAKAAALPGYTPLAQRPEGAFLPALVDEFLQTLGDIDPARPPTDPPAKRARKGFGAEGERRAVEQYCERFIELLTDLLSQLPTRRFVHTLLEDRAVLIKAKRSSLARGAHRSPLFAQLVDRLQLFLQFEIDNHTGEPLHEEEVLAAQYERIQQFQRLAFAHLPALRDAGLGHCGAVADRESLGRFLDRLSPEELHRLATLQLRLVGEGDPMAQDAGFLREVMLSHFERRKFRRETINELPLYPTEGVLGDPAKLPSVHYSGETVLALPKLNLQFLSFHDYLLRNFILFQLESTYEIREDLEDAVKRLSPYEDKGAINFRGWARMAVPIKEVKITEVRPPRIGERCPSLVTATATYSTGAYPPPIRAEWDALKQHDVVFLVTMRPPREGLPADAPPLARLGLVYVRGAEVVEIKDEEDRLMNDFSGKTRFDERRAPAGVQRALTLQLDAAQYQLDAGSVEQGSEDVYPTLNLLVRRKAKENNFKAVLEAIRDLMNEDCVMPQWLQDVFLGYGDPAAAQPEALPSPSLVVDAKDTFLDAKHVEEVFGGEYRVEFAPTPGLPPLPPFRLHFPKEKPFLGSKDNEDVQPGARAAPAAGPLPPLRVASYLPPPPGPYPEDRPPLNPVRFTTVQVQAILSGVRAGLTMVVGPPGTGKTDTATQLLHLLYHNHPEQRTLLITHSNQALNDLFQKIAQRDVPSRYLLRLGAGEEELETDQSFSRAGRVNAMLERRLQLLGEVERMARVLQVPGHATAAYTCETAAHFYLLHVLARWERFRAQAEQSKAQAQPGWEGAVQLHFPFTEFFTNLQQPLFVGEYEADWRAAEGCFRHLQTMFTELEECRAFELLRGQGDRIDYLLTKQSKIVAMTCTHAALKRREFLRLGFTYDNVVMEEAAQVLEIETFIPLLMQKQDPAAPRLKRLILIGDHHQLPPVVQNMAFAKYAHLDQSLFTRFVRLGTPYIELNAQGRARPELARLYNWRYRALGDLPAVSAEGSPFQRANPGFAFDAQFIDVPDFQGRGESEPLPYFYQNLAEAEYVVSVYQYMRLLGYPAHRITLLTTYNGQKHLLKDVIDRRCAHDPRFGAPHKIATVDKYQGQQNDYVLLSLVRTRAVGHLRDVRRLVVAMSRARLGLYVFGRAALFGNCYELRPTFAQLLARPTALCLAPGEAYGACGRGAGEGVAPLVIADLVHMAHFVVMMAQQRDLLMAQQMQEGGGGEGVEVEGGMEGLVKAAAERAAAAENGGPEGEEDGEEEGA